MKKILLFVAALFVAVSFSSCDRDDEGTDASIVGTWMITNQVGFEIGGEQSGRRDWNTSYPIDNVNDDYGFYYIYVFNENGTGTYKSYNYYDNNKLQEQSAIGYSVSNNILMFPAKYEYNGTFEIKQLTDNQLVLFEEIDDNDGYKAEITSTFKKI